MTERGENSTKIRENLLRRMAERQGLALRKSRSRDRLALDFGVYKLLDASSGATVNGDLTSLEEVATALSRPRRR